MRMNKNLGMVLLSIWLLCWGLVGLFKLGGGRISTILEIFALVVGVVILLFDKAPAGTGA